MVNTLVAEPLAEALHGVPEVAHVVPVAIEAAVHDEEPDARHDGKADEAEQRTDGLEGHRDAEEHLLDAGAVLDLTQHGRRGTVQRLLAHRSISPRTMSIDPRVTTASGSEEPSPSSRRSERLMSAGERRWNRYGAGVPSETR